MCRLSAFFGAPICAADLVTRPSRSIITQSFDARERMSGDASTPGYLNGDGFGLGWYAADRADVTPCVYRQARPAWNDANLGPIAEKVITPVLFAHVRAASPGMDVSETTCHPFRYGRYLWMHNGGVGDFHKVRRKLLLQLSEEAFDWAVNHGSSDTALCFAVFLSLIDDKMAKSTPDALRKCMDKTLMIIEDAIRDVGSNKLSLLNFVVSDGDTLVASRYVVNFDNPTAPAASLYYASGNSYQSDGSAPGNYAMVHTHRRPTLAIVSSEPLTEKRSDWVSVPRNHIVVITQSIHILLCPVARDDSSADVSDALVNLVVSGRPTPPFESRPFVRENESHFPVLPFSLRKVPPGLPIYAKGSTALMTMEGSSAARQQHASPISQTRSTITIQGQPTVLSCAVLGAFLCSGTQDGTIHVWNMDESVLSETFQTGHGAVMALLTDEKRELLVSASSASVVCSWRMSSAGHFTREHIVRYDGKGDVLSLALVNSSVYAGFSDTVVRCVIEDVDDGLAAGTLEGKSHDTVGKTNCIRYEDSSGSGGSFSSENGGTKAGPPVSALRLPRMASQDGARHFGFVFALAPCDQNRYICTGCGDGVVRVWSTATGECTYSRDGHTGAVLALAVFETAKGALLFSGSCDRSVKVWDADRGFICKRTIRKHKDDVLFISIAGDKLVTGSVDGAIWVWCAQSLYCYGQYRSDALSAGAVSLRHNLLFTASDRGVIHVRDLVPMVAGQHHGGLPPKVQLTAAGHRQASAGALPPYSKGSAAPVTDAVKRLGNSPGGNDQTEIGDALGDSREDGDDEDDDDDVDTLVRGVSNSMILAPPMDPAGGCAQPRALRLSKQALAESSHCALGSIGNKVTGGLADLDRGNLRAGEGSEINGHDGKDDSNFASGGGVYVEIDKNEIEREQAGGDEATAFSLRMLEERLMQDVLARFISFATVSGSDEHGEECWQGARYIGTFLESLGAAVKFVGTSSSPAGVDTVSAASGKSPSSTRSLPPSPTPLHQATNPIVLARFASARESAPTLTFYGHYDVMPADASQWESDPWLLTPLNGYYYGRGATDNKGPILAMVFAIKSLLESSKDGLGINIVLVLEGEGETRNAGFKACVKSHAHWFKNTVLILTSNSYWLGEERPCITYGFRGVIDLHVSISGGKRNLHSGVDGGAVFEPVTDLLAILGTLVDASGEVCVPGFNDDVRPLSEEDKQRLRDVEFDLDEYQAGTGVVRFTSGNAFELLQLRWRRPSISVTSLETSNASGFYSVVPRQASAKLSIRFVPDQDPQKIEDAVRAHLEFELRKRRSPNKLQMMCVNRGDWWLGEPSSPHFQIAERALRSVWGVDPQYVSEGGSMPLFSFLAKTLAAPLVQVPLGQSSDSAHLPNERIRAMNLHRGKQVLQRIVQEVSDQHTT